MIYIGQPAIVVRLKRNARARRLTLRLSSVDAMASLTLPPRISLREATAFAARQEDWLRGQIARMPARMPVKIGSEIMFQGNNTRLVAGNGRLVALGAEGIVINPVQTAARLRAFLKTEARNAVVPAAEAFAAQLSKPVGRISLRDTRSRWGSCSGAGNLMFSWRLVMAPPAVLRYVAAHEVAHLQEMNHSQAFWDVVARLMPDYQIHRVWLKKHGAKLHRVDFSS
ncbi:MAG: SprT family zinc-dependent metalloprotease [Paracoccaceae bacterium]